MTSRSHTSIDKMLLLIPVPVRAALEGEFHLQVKIASTKHLNDELVAVQATSPQAALPSLPLIVTEVTPAKTEKPVTETSGSNQGKRKAPSDAPPCPRESSTNPIAVFPNATIVAAASAAAAIATTTTAAITTKGGFPLVVCADMEIYNWDRQTLCPRTDCFKLVACF
jgi:hypothetical protein